MKRSARLLFGLGLAGAAAASACPLPAPALQRGAVQASWQPAGAPMVVGRHFAIELRVCPIDALLVRVDALMPEHGHGMNYRPSLTALGPGRWRADGLMLHMPGRWELRLDLRIGERAERLTDTVLLP